MPHRLIIPGRPNANFQKTDEEVAEFLDVEIVHATNTGIAARGSQAEEDEFADARDDDVLEIEYEDGICRWISVQQYCEELEASGLRSRQDREIRIEPLTRGFGPSRGVRDRLLKGVRILRPNFDEIAQSAGNKAGELTAMKLAEYFEGKLKPGPGLYQWDDPNKLGKKLVESDLADDEPILLFLHGTLSTTFGSFGALTESNNDHEWKHLRSRYPGRMIALEHPTLTQSPIENALEVVRRLPPKATLHLVSHSRGGLIGELLAAADFDRKELKRYVRKLADSATQDEKDRQDLEQLFDELDAKRVKIERFVRVACPARGTILASGRLDRYLSVIVNTIGWIPGLKEHPLYSRLYGFAKATAIALVKQRTKPEELPGLEAQMPTSPLIRIMNHPGARSEADLGVISGDLEASSLGKKVLELLTDAFYWEGHDLVVNTRAMYGGLNRHGNAYYFFDRGDSVNHFRYFRNSETRRAMYRWLTEAPQNTGFKPLQERDDEGISRSARSRDVPQPEVFVLPGIMGSHLNSNGKHVWLNKLNVALGGMSDLTVDSTDVTPSGLIAKSYEDLIEFLAGSHQVRPFPFDWRMSIDSAADKLAIAIKETLGRTREPVRILAHSLGGLVARSMMKRHEDVWDGICERDGGRLLMLGTPNRGSYEIPRVLLGQERIVKLLALLDFDNNLGELLEIVRRFPGLLELLPDQSDGDSLDLFDAKDWKKLCNAAGGPAKAPAEDDLKAARRRRNELGETHHHVDRILYVAGTAPATPSGVKIDGGRVVFQATTAGDGRVTYESGLLENVRTWYMPTEHGNLANHQPSFHAIEEILAHGETGRLATESPAVQRGAIEEFELPEDVVVHLPDEDDLVGAALGHVPAARGAAREARLRVAVVGGDLIEATYPLLVGHHVNGAIVSAERRLDEQLEGRLSRRHRYSLYPGRPNTTVVIHEPKSDPPGAIVIGLGKIGDTNPQLLAEYVTTGVLEYAITLAEEAVRIDESDGAEEQPIGISSLLIGAGDGSPLSIEESLTAILRGVVEANRRLRAGRTHEKYQIQELELIELFEGRAISAAHGVQRVQNLIELEDNERIVADSELAVKRGVRNQTGPTQDAEAWWQRIRITSSDDDSGLLSFIALTERARAESIPKPTQTALIDELISQTVKTIRTDEVFASMLYELLLPIEMKLRAREARDVVLVLDEKTANYPWEFLMDRTVESPIPLAVRAGLVRQLVTESFRRNPQLSATQSALVVGDPDLQARPGVPQLDGARVEAEKVQRVLFDADFKPTWLDRPNAVDVIKSVVTGRFQLLHLAGHGFFNLKEPSKSGLVLGGNIYLTAREIADLNPLPELVFLNCCHIGQIDVNRGAASISQELISSGVRAVIAAGWAVDDGAAVTFAQEFYRRFLQGEKFGRAVQRARLETFQQHPEVNTWGAYQCYGDPDFTLTATSRVRRYSNQPKAEFISRREYKDAFRNVASSAAVTDLRGREWLQTRLEQLEKEMPVKWRNDGAMLTEVAEAYKGIGQTKRAIERYQQAIEQENSSATIRAIEQLTNLRIRELPKDLAAGTPGAEAAVLEIGRYVQILNKLNDISTTSERLSLLGSANKRLAQLETDRKRRAALKQAAEAYEAAHRRAYESSDLIDPYPAINWLTFRVLLGDPPDDLERILEESEKAARIRRIEQPTFWNDVTQPDAAVIRHLANGDLDAHVEKVFKMYRRARKRGTIGEFESVLDQFDFLIKMLRDSKIGSPARGGKKAHGRKDGARDATPANRVRKRNVAALESLRERLGAVS